MTTKHCIQILITLGACAAAAAAPALAADARSPYAHVLATLVEPQEDGADSGFGGLVELGAPADFQSFDGDALFEAGWIGWDQSETIDGIRAEADADFVPILVAYRAVVSFGPEERIHLGIGPAIGATYSSIEASATLDDTRYSVSGSQWNFTWGGELALVYEASGGLDLTAGYKYLSTDAGDLEIQGVSYDLGSVDTHVFYLGAGWRW